MPQQELLRRVVLVLNETEVPYMVTGSIASSLQGEPRSTHDIDIVITLQEKQAKKLSEAFPSSDFFLDENTIINAIEKKGMFNLIDLKEGDKVDFWMLTDDPFDQSRFSRTYLEEFEDLKIRVSSPEDTILAKLKWAKLSGGSEKQFTDALRVYELQFGNLNLDYLETWVKKLEIDSLWKLLKKDAEIV